MKNIIIILGITFIVFSCRDNKKNEISFDTIDFYNSEELQDFILKTPNSIHFQTVLDTLKKLRKSEYLNSDYIFRDSRNRFRILMNNKGRALFIGRILNIDKLSDSLEYCLTNSTNPDLPVMDNVEIGESGQVLISKGIITLKSGENVPQESYTKVINEINECINSIKESWSFQLYGKNHNELDKEIKDIFDKILQSRIILEEYFEVKHPESIPHPIIEVDTVEIELIDEKENGI